MTRTIRRVLASTSIVVAIAALCIPAALADDAKESYYLSLGDSLAQGGQPTGGPDTLQSPPGFNQGYADQLFKLEREAFPRLRLAKLGCSGESTATMITDPYCFYPAGSQLDEAVALLEAYAGRIEFVTIDIGANDVIECLFTEDQACFDRGIAAVRANVPVILEALRAAGGSRVPIVGMTYYNLFSGTLAGTMLETLNIELERIYAAAGVAVAQVDDAFAANPASACAWTWICSKYQDIHPTTEGYGVIAQAFARALPAP